MATDFGWDRLNHSQKMPVKVRATAALRRPTAALLIPHWGTRRRGCLECCWQAKGPLWIACALRCCVEINGHVQGGVYLRRKVP
jgi:hypothetical protein